MTDKKSKKPSKAELEKQYFQEASEWDQDVIARSNKSEKRAWAVAMGVDSDPRGRRFGGSRPFKNG
ncbi:hypothetical protein K6745_23865 (plasmid) [Vibrio alginolyticus]|uniref:hypothetical protein n=1 Tax=Vibrio alginolyticus TaxID=663 RepID=UPI001EEF1305|nr:hypothetical protein [Vibrio alginolyticus]ULF72074.1 hypothetical protein K6745_23865 [Vibrio alginolyticus]